MDIVLFLMHISMSPPHSPDTLKQKRGREPFGPLPRFLYSLPIIGFFP